MKTNTIKTLFLSLASALLFVQCEKQLEFEPDGVLLEDEAIQTKDDLQMLLNAAYEVMANGFNGQSQNLHELLSDDVAPPERQDDYIQVYNRRTDIFNGTVNNVYREPYFAINRANVIRESVDLVSGVTPSERQRLIAEADFIRAYCLFDVVKLWAQPYGYTPDNSHPGVAVPYEETNEPLPRSSVRTAYNYITGNLRSAEANLPDDNGNYASKWAAKGALAQVYFQMGKYDSAYFYANEIINSGRYSLESMSDPLDFRFLTDQVSTETIFGSVSSNTGDDNRSGGYTGNWRKGNQPTMTVSKDFFNLYFPTGADTNTIADRRGAWFTILNAGEPSERVALNKFDKDYFNIPLIHLTEMKLIRAEAAATLGIDLVTAAQDVNDIKVRAGLPPTLPSNASAEDIITEVRWERRLEMIGEGDRTSQIKRIGAIEGENIESRGAPWNCNGMVLQFPAVERTEIFELNPEGGC
jgi:hypothetical protein